jgi:hypothetical protein
MFSDLTTLTILDYGVKVMKLIVSVFRPPVTSSFSGPNIFLGIFFLNTVKAYRKVGLKQPSNMNDLPVDVPNEILLGLNVIIT